MSSAELTLRDEYKTQTHSRILDSAIELMREKGEQPLTFAAVAARANVTERTVYRHFETRDALLRAVWQRLQSIAGSEFPRTADALVKSAPRLFPRFDESRELVRSSIYNPAGLDVRLSSNAERQQAFLASVRDALPGLDEAALRRRAAVAQLINSAYAWEVMWQLWGLDGEQAGEASSEALAVLLGLRRADQ